MSSNTKTYQNKLSLGLGRVFLLLALLQSLAALVSETQRLSTIGPEVISKLSPTQIIISLAIIIAIFFIGALLLLSFFQPKRMEGRLAQLATWLNNPVNWARITLLITLDISGGRLLSHPDPGYPRSSYRRGFETFPSNRIMDYGYVRANTDFPHLSALWVQFTPINAKG